MLAYVKAHAPCTSCTYSSPGAALCPAACAVTCAAPQYLLQGMQLSVAAGGVSWLVMNGAMAAWNAYLPLMQKERYADLAGLLLPVFQTLLQVWGAVGVF